MRCLVPKQALNTRGAQMMEAQMVRLDDACRELGVPLILARSYGLVGYLRASLPEHCVVESKPDNTVEDLRLHRPWPALAEYARSFDLAAVDDVTHRHIPWGAGTYPGVRAWCLVPKLTNRLLLLDGW